MMNTQAEGTFPRIQWRRVPLLALAMLALFAAMWAGILRLGWPWPPLRPTLPMAHGPLMVGGFLGTLISLERAIALGKRWTFAAPLATGLGALMLIAGISGWPGPLLITVGSALLVVIMGADSAHPSDLLWHSHYAGGCGLAHRQSALVRGATHPNRRTLVDRFSRSDGRG